MDLWYLSNMKVIVIFWTQNMLIVFLFLVSILLILFTIEPTNLKKIILEFPKNMIKPQLIQLMYLTLGWFSNYVAFDEIKWLFIFTKYSTQKFK